MKKYTFFVGDNVRLRNTLQCGVITEYIGTDIYLCRFGEEDVLFNAWDLTPHTTFKQRLNQLFTYLKNKTA